ncbi:MAG: ATP-binding protein [Spirochaeta sp.]|nr:ATP-binding protein [Spirochaeta sp.]
MRIQYPFSAVVGQEALKTALILCAIDSGLGGVLIQGHKGTAKTTTVRGIGSLIPGIKVRSGCRFNCDPADPAELCDVCTNAQSEVVTAPSPVVNLPLNLTEDRLVGSMDVSAALTRAERRFDPGLLAAAHRGILYVDEVNLLSDHLVDMLLDVAASGENIVEREGMSYRHPAEFVLVGTMNPEEGELRPQFLDRFGLCVQVNSVRDVGARREIVRRRMAFERDPEAFVLEYSDEEDLLRRQIALARTRLSAVHIAEEAWDFAVRVAVNAGVQGHRAELTIMKTAVALAAFLERDEVGLRHVSEAARLVLPHRMKSSPFADEEQTSADIDDLIAGAAGEDAKYCGLGSVRGRNV